MRVVTQRCIKQWGCAQRRQTYGGAGALRSSSSSSSQATSMALQQGYIPRFMQRIAEVNNGVEEVAAGRLVPFQIQGTTVGHLKPDFAAKLQQAAPQVFCSSPLTPSSSSSSQRPLTLAAGLDTLEQRTEAVAGVLQQLRGQGVIHGWRDELYPVTPAFDSPPLLLVERAAAPFFGIRAYGVHLNGYVVGEDGAKLLWVARRSAAKPTWPGKLDHLVAGGQPHGLSCAENIVKECYEEAGVAPEVAAAAAPVGYVSYVSLSEEGLKPDVLFCYDLQLPRDFQPVPQDGEVESFQLMTLQQVADVMANTTDYKPNCVLVIIDFLLRHGAITPDEPGYLALVQALRQGDAR